MVPIDSNVASSNMAASLKSRIQPRRIGDGRLAAERECPARSALRSEHRGAGAAGSRPSDHPIRYHCAYVDTACLKSVPGCEKKFAPCYTLQEFAPLSELV